MCNMAGQTAGFGSGVGGGRGVEGLFGETRLGQETWEPPLKIQWGQGLGALVLPSF